MNTITLLQEFAEQRPGLEFGNYGCRQSYASERRTIQKQLRHARLILEACNSLGVSDECWNYAMETDRLKIRNGVVDFTACQYFPTEYIPEEHDIETVMQEAIKKPRKKKK